MCKLPARRKGHTKFRNRLDLPYKAYLANFLSKNRHAAFWDFMKESKAEGNIYRAQSGTDSVRLFVAHRTLTQPSVLRVDRGPHENPYGGDGDSTSFPAPPSPLNDTATDPSVLAVENASRPKRYNNRRWDNNRNL